MGKMVIPKNSASLEEVMGAMQIYYDANDWLPNADYIQAFKNRIGIIGDDGDSSAYTKRTEIGAYYGFIEWQDINKVTSPRRITSRGKQFLEHYNANDTDAIHEDIMCSLEEITFGRNNFACRSSDSDIDPPALFLRAVMDLGYLTNTEFAYLVYKMEYEAWHYTETIQDIKTYRNRNESVPLPDEGRKFSDPKPILMLERWGVLTSTQAGGSKRTSINTEFLNKYQQRLRNLKIYNIDKNISISDTADEEVVEDVDDNEQHFRVWFSTQRTVYGVTPTPSTISSNCRALKNVCALLPLDDYPELDNLFAITDIAVYLDIKQALKAHPDYAEVNRTQSNGFINTSLTWYEKYLTYAPKITWNMEEDAVERYGGLVDVVMNPSDRRTDIVVENKATNKQMIIDAKFYHETLVRGYRDSTIERYRRSHIDQVRGYVLDSKFPGKKLGALVYPTVKEDFPRPRIVPMQGSLVLFKTLNLNKDWRDIEQDLLAFTPLLEQVLDQQQS